MNEPLFETPDQRTQAIIVAAGVALHGILVAGGSLDNSVIDLWIERAFYIGRKFIETAEKMP